MPTTGSSSAATAAGSRHPRPWPHLRRLRHTLLLALGQVEHPAALGIQCEARGQPARLKHLAVGQGALPTQQLCRIRLPLQRLLWLLRFRRWRLGRWCCCCQLARRKFGGYCRGCSGCRQRLPCTTRNPVVSSWLHICCAALHSGAGTSAAAVVTGAGCCLHTGKCRRLKTPCIVHLLYHNHAAGRRRRVGLWAGCLCPEALGLGLAGLNTQPQGHQPLLLCCHQLGARLAVVPHLAAVPAPLLSPRGGMPQLRVAGVCFPHGPRNAPAGRSEVGGGRLETGTQTRRQHVGNMAAACSRHSALLCVPFLPVPTPPCSQPCRLTACAPQTWRPCSSGRG